ncbi:MAG: hypothetical protein WKF52_05610 [Sphingomicrobium sp.]
MEIDKMLGSAFELFDKEWEAIQFDLQNAVRRAVDEKTRDAGENAQKHPLQSSTPLKEASFRAHSTVTRLEKKFERPIATALGGLVSIAFAQKFAANVDRAIELDQRAKREKGESGLYAAARKAVDRIYDFGAGKWHWAQQADPELSIYSDLLRWKADDPAHDDPNSPWPEIKAIYKQRSRDRDLGEKLTLSLPKKPQSGFRQAKPITQIPTVAEMQTIAGDWAWYSTNGSAQRTTGVGQLDTDDPYGGFLRRKIPEAAMAMQEREDLYEPPGPRLNDRHWSRFDVPRSTYAVVEVRSGFDFPTLPQLYPPLATLRLIGVTLDYRGAKQRELEEAEAGEGPSDIIIETVRACFVRYNRCHDEDLIRFWLFLLVGRKYPDRVDALFPPGYFHGVRGPDIVESRESPTHFQLVRVAADQNFRHMMRHPDFGPWGGLR